MNIYKIKNKLQEKNKEINFVNNFKNLKNNYEKTLKENKTLKETIVKNELIFKKKLSDIEKSKSITTQKIEENNRQYAKYKKSTLYNTERARFCRKDNSVKWELDDKIEAYNYVEQFNIKHPEIIAKIENINELKELEESGKLPVNFVLKISNMHSCIGVFLLRKLDNGMYFDDLTCRTYTIEEIIKKEKIVDENKPNVLRETYYFIEESIPNFVDFLKIPFDYKVFCINGIPKLILQMDRNVTHYSLAMFDGNFVPLVEGRDWFINPEKCETTVPIIPPNAYQILSKSAEIAKRTDDRHVRIDWFDNGKEPVFGEFTFCSGATYTGLFTFSDEIIENLNKSFEEENYDDYSQKGYHIDGEQLLKFASTPLDFITIEYMEIIKKCIYGNYIAINEMILYFKKKIQKTKSRKKILLYQHLVICWTEVLVIYQNKYTEYLCRYIKDKWGFIKSDTFYFNERIAEAKKALWEVSKDNDWFKIRFAQFIFDFGGSEVEIEKSHNYVNYFAKKNRSYALEVKKRYNIK